MATAELLVDTGVLVDHLRGRRRLSARSDALAISVVTRCELFAGADAVERLRQLLDAFAEIPVDRAVAELAGTIRRETGIATPDALIAATALEHRIPVMTRNRRHFDRVGGLDVVAPG